MQEKGKHYVIGDVHGCYEDFLLLKERIDPEATIILTGDFLDRGPEVWEMLGWAMEHIGRAGNIRVSWEIMKKWFWSGTGNGDSGIRAIIRKRNQIHTMTLIW